MCAHIKFAWPAVGTCNKKTKCMNCAYVEHTHTGTHSLTHTQAHSHTHTLTPTQSQLAAKPIKLRLKRTVKHKNMHAMQWSVHTHTPTHLHTCTVFSLDLSGKLKAISLANKLKANCKRSQKLIAIFLCLILQMGEQSSNGNGSSGASSAAQSGPDFDALRKACNARLSNSSHPEGTTATTTKRTVYRA